MPWARKLAQELLDARRQVELRVYYSLPPEDLRLIRNLTMDEALVLGSFPRAGMAERDFAQVVHMSGATAQLVKTAMLRRRLLKRNPPGRERADTLVELTRQGERAWSALNGAQRRVSDEMWAQLTPEQMQRLAETMATMAVRPPTTT